MKPIYPIFLICVVALVIIGKESSILSRVYNTKVQTETRHPSPKPLDQSTTTPSDDVTLDKLLLSHQTSAKATDSTVPDEQEEHKTDTQTGGRRHVLLMATTRTGSSFVGEFFNQQRENLFYLYEPLWHVTSKYSEAFEANNATVFKYFQDVLQELFHCNFSALEEFISPPPTNHVTAVFFRRESSYALCEESVCSPVAKDVSERFPCKIRRCGPLNLTLASELCQSRQNLVIKTVRVDMLDTLKPLMEHPNLNLKIIQLVRDPRAILASRLVVFSYRYRAIKAWAQDTEMNENDDELKKLKENCDKISASAETALSRPPWLKNNYMLVRYEDIASDPMQMAEEMYKFTGIPFSPQAREWILTNTQSADQHNNAYSTRRNSSEQTDKWRANIPFPLVQVVQKLCGPAMKLFGYKFVDDEKTLHNKSISLLEEKQFG